jgi:hypothetical protein
MRREWIWGMAALLAAAPALASPEPLTNVLIHETLHTLGLGEDPPSSTEITKVVLRHCR